MPPDVDEMIASYFANWRPLASVALTDFPRFGDVAVVYAIRARGGEVLKFGKTDNLRDRVFKNYIGGMGGATTQRIHAQLFAHGHIADVEFAWHETERCRQLERQLAESYRRKYGRLPRWMRVV